MEIRVDRRRLVIGSAREAEAIAEREIVWMREHAVILARALERIERERSYLREGCSSAVDWAVRRKMDRGRATELLRLGRVLALVPDAADEVERGEVTPQAAAVAGRLVPKTPTLPPKQPVDPVVEEQQRREAAARAQEALERSKVVPPSRYRSEVATAVEEIAQGERAVRLSFDVKERVRDAWRRARKLASRRAERHLTEGESFEAVTTDYLDRHDPLWKEPRTRRVGPTADLPDSRYVPAEVRREVTVRAHDHCEFPGCGNGVFLQNAHRVCHRDRGSREPDNLGPLCTPHHTMEDAGLIRFLERTPAGVTYVHTQTGEIFEPDPRKDAADPLPEPARPHAPEPGGGADGGGRRQSDCGRRRKPQPPDGVGEPRPPCWVLQPG